MEANEMVTAIQDSIEETANGLDEATVVVSSPALKDGKVGKAIGKTLTVAAIAALVGFPIVKAVKKRKAKKLAEQNSLVEDDSDEDFIEDLDEEEEDFVNQKNP